MRLQSTLFCLAFVFMAGANLPTLVEGGSEYSRCITERVNRAVNNSSRLLNSSARPCLDDLKHNVTAISLPLYTDLPHDYRHGSMTDAFRNDLKTLNECMEEQKVTWVVRYVVTANFRFGEWLAHLQCHSRA